MAGAGTIRPLDPFGPVSSDLSIGIRPITPVPPSGFVSEPVDDRPLALHMQEMKEDGRSHFVIGTIVRMLALDR